MTPVKLKYFFQAAKLGEEIYIDARTLKKGRTLAFLECEIKNAQGKQLMTYRKIIEIQEQMP